MQVNNEGLAEHVKSQWNTAVDQFRKASQRKDLKSNQKMVVLIISQVLNMIQLFQPSPYLILGTSDDEVAGNLDELIRRFKKLRNHENLWDDGELMS